MTERSTGSGRFVLRLTSSSDVAPEDLKALAAMPAVRVVERSGRLVRVEGEEARLRDFVRDDARWELFPEVEYRVPERRPMPG